MCALGAFLRNGKNGYREKLALLLQENEKEKQTRRRWKGYVTLTEEDDDNVSRIFALKPHQVEDNEPQSMQQPSMQQPSPHPSSTAKHTNALAPSSFGRRRKAPKGFEDYIRGSKSRYSRTDDEIANADATVEITMAHSDSNCIPHIIGPVNKFGLFRKTPGLLGGNEGHIADQNDNGRSSDAAQNGDHDEDSMSATGSEAQEEGSQGSLLR